MDPCFRAFPVMFAWIFTEHLMYAWIFMEQLTYAYIFEEHRIYVWICTEHVIYGWIFMEQLISAWVFPEHLIYACILMEHLIYAWIFTEHLMFAWILLTAIYIYIRIEFTDIPVEEVAITLVATTCPVPSPTLHLLLDLSKSLYIDDVIAPEGSTKKVPHGIFIHIS